jgi:hypothetical protein
VPSDADRFRFLATRKLTLHTNGENYVVHFCRTQGPGKPPIYYPVPNGDSAEEAIDQAIDRYNRKHGIRTPS